MIVSYTHEIPMGHRLQHHKGKCRFLHGHNYLVEVTVGGTVNEVTGMVIDFSELKRVTKMVLDPFDHAFVLQEGDNILREIDQERIIYLPFPPTAENLAQHWTKMIRVAMHYDPMTSAERIYVAVNETRDCRVSM